MTFRSFHSYRTQHGTGNTTTMQVGDSAPSQKLRDLAMSFLSRQPKAADAERWAEETTKNHTFEDNTADISGNTTAPEPTTDVTETTQESRDELDNPTTTEEIAALGAERTETEEDTTKRDDDILLDVDVAKYEHPNHVVQALLQAAERGHDTILELVLSAHKNGEVSGPGITSIKDADLASALSLAACSGQRNAVAKLIAAGVDAKACPDAYNASPLTLLGVMATMRKLPCFWRKGLKYPHAQRKQERRHCTLPPNMGRTVGS
ncbi:hypothetical protein FN846DRAFT_1024665 [Sphaerosporella brunnea]|uniref:Ankyrin repeat-containing domain protein n=1 Tax=Sphaerosporella brunnea TaxID=1250544 RepID=A0A5J5EIQ9_9PEZI|nr:hypothetical protein FN846DRAFT_1024665 [Sphaerosporella brunnea]